MSDKLEIDIIPAVVEFNDVQVGSVLKRKVQVINCGKLSKEIRFITKQSKHFKFEFTNRDESIAPGLCAVAVIRHAVVTEEEKIDELTATIDGCPVTIPIKAYPRRPLLHTDSHLSFGLMSVGTGVVSRKLYIHNEGSLDGEFRFSYSGTLPLTVNPSSGKVQPKSAKIVKVELVTETVGSFSEAIKIVLEGCEPSVLQVSGNIINSSLQLLSYMSDEPLQCIKFSPTYFGSDNTESAILLNNSPDIVRFVVILNDNAEGQLTGQVISGQGRPNDVASMVTVLPHYGKLNPYEKIPMFFKFSPRWNQAVEGFKCTKKKPPCQDFAFFIQILKVGDGNTAVTGQHDGSSKTQLEVGLTGLAVPVDIHLNVPSQNCSQHDNCAINFGHRYVGSCAAVPLTLSNRSGVLPVTFQFRRIAHFTCQPQRGRLQPGQSIDVQVTYAPNQVGIFHMDQNVDIIGQVSDEDNPVLLRLEVIHTILIQLHGTSKPITVVKDPVFNPGITPKITNEVGLFVGPKNYEISQLPRNTRHNAHRIKVIKNRRNQAANDAFVALPNDRAQSIGPSDRRQNHETLFTGVQRYTYIDPDYAYTDDQTEAVQHNKEFYASFINSLRQMRHNKLAAIEHKRYDNNIDINLQPNSGVRPRKLTVADVTSANDGETVKRPEYQLLTTTQLRSQELQSYKQSRDGLSAVPTTIAEKADCQKILTPLQLHQIIIGPSSVNFGEVCVKSTSQRDVDIINNLDQFVHVVINVDCTELRQTSPLSHVVPPASRAVVPVIFESNTKGRFQRSIEYTINGFYQNRFTVFADVVSVNLELSTNSLELESCAALPPDSSVRGTVQLINKLNLMTSFTWNPVVGEKGSAFTIRPAAGTVDAFSNLRCEVVYYPSFLAPVDGEFVLKVHGGSTRQLRCVAKLGPANVQLVDKRLMFGQVPLHLTTWKNAALKNFGLNHAYFQVLNPSPFPGLTLSPVYGVIPVGGVTMICATLTPDAVVKFDSPVNISIRNGRPVDLRIGGTVEPPVVDIDVPKFNFGGVYCGSKAFLPFTLTNKGHTKVRVEFDLSRSRDFSIDFSDKQTTDDSMFQLLNPGLFAVSVSPEDHITCQLIFTPTEVASYEFVMNATINETLAPSPAPTPLPPAPGVGRATQHIITPRPQNCNIVTPRRKVSATAMRQLLQFSTLNVNFSVSAALLDLVTGIGQCQSIQLLNNSEEELQWALDVNPERVSSSVTNGIFRFVQSAGTPFVTSCDDAISGCLKPGETETICIQFCPVVAGKYEAIVPVMLNNNTYCPYQYLTIVGHLRAPSLQFTQPTLMFSAVPLNVDTSAQVIITPTDYSQTATLTVVTPDVECEDGSVVSPLSVTFTHQSSTESTVATIESSPVTEASDVTVCRQNPNITCTITFKSSKPVSFTQPIKFIDGLGHSFELQVTAAADNCLLTSYPFLSQHRNDHHIVCAQGKSLKGHTPASREGSSVGEAQLLALEQCSGSRPTSTLTSSTFGVSSSSYESSSYASTDNTTSRGTPHPRDGAINKFETDTEKEFPTCRNEAALKSLASSLFPEEDSDDGEYFNSVLNAVQRWFSCNGWPGAINLVTIPDSFRCSISRKLEEDRSKSNRCTTSTSAVEKETRTIYDMVAYLSGKPLPGINLNCSLPADVNLRVQQIYQQHQILLTFIRSQGGCVAHIKPEYLLEPRDYRQWMKLHNNNLSKVGGKVEMALDDLLFDSLSKRAWMDVLLQIIKTLVLAKITPRQFKNMPTPHANLSLHNVDANPLCSNIYSIGERIVLAWLNQQYEQMRETIWASSKIKGGIPPTRWIVNFDFNLLDGLVIAAVLASHAPFLISTHLTDMYTRPSNAEQCLHNALCVVNAMKYIGLDYDIQAVDITDPNPVCLLLLCINLYFNMPQYLSRSIVQFDGALHSKVTRQVKLSNPSSKPLIYHAILCGRDAREFIIPRGTSVVVPPKSSSNVTVEFTSRFMRPSEAVLVLAGRRLGATAGCTIVFTLKTNVISIMPQSTLHCETPCYQHQLISVHVTNPFGEAGTFHIVLVELNGEFPGNVPDISTATERKSKSKSTTATTTTDAMPVVGGNRGELRAFFCAMRTVYLPGHSSDNVDVTFLPFSPGKRQCALILTDESVGELLYLVTGTALLPLPEDITSSGDSPVDETSSVVSDKQDGRMNVVAWKCDLGQTVEKTLQLPVRNMARERALALAARLVMSESELYRHTITGTLASGSVMAKTVALLSSTSNNLSVHINSLFAAQSINNNNASSRPGPVTGDRVYSVEIDNSKNFALSVATVKLPEYTTSSACTSAEYDTVQLPVKFTADEPGEYKCRVTLRSSGVGAGAGDSAGASSALDIRIFNVFCLVTPPGNSAYIEFISPINQAVVQNIPIVNGSKADWLMTASLEGNGFSGPQQLVATAGLVTQYPLQFLPRLEGAVQGKLKLTNTVDGVQHEFTLQGRGDKPLPLDTITLKMQARRSIDQVIAVPNMTKHKIVFKVESDISFFSGADSLVVLPGQTAYYDLRVRPLRRGKYRGVLAFVASDEQVCPEIDSDGDEIIEESTTLTDGKTDGYYLWYAVNITVLPAEPQSTLTITCPCQQEVVLEIGVNNPTDEKLCLETVIEGHGLSGESSVTLGPGERQKYHVTFTPLAVGVYSGSVSMFHERVGEFWYRLLLTAESPVPTVLPSMESELGSWSRQIITLHNHTNEPITLEALITNPNNFTLEYDTLSPLVLPASAALEIPVVFAPSKLGTSDQSTTINFASKQLGDWLFTVSGVGLLPRVQDAISITAMMGDNSTLIIPFRNPTDVHILIDIQLKVLERELSYIKSEMSSTALTTSPAAHLPFCLLLKSQRHISVGPKSTLQIPISFAPQDMRTYNVHCIISAQREDGSYWEPVPAPGYNALDQTAGLRSLSWVFPVTGFTEVAPPKNTRPALFESKARQRIEMRLEVILTGSVSGPKQIMKCRPMSASDQNVSHTADGIIVGDALSMTEEFHYDLVYLSEEAKVDVEPAVAIQLIRQTREEETGIVTLTFDVVYAPFKVMKHRLLLSVQGASGGRWSFPLEFRATEPEPDDIVYIEAVGLNKISTVAFRLSSHLDVAIPYTASFISGRDSSEFCVFPQTGVLPPASAGPGALITVGFTPRKYGRAAVTKLLVQTTDVHWTYEIRGVLPVYNPPPRERVDKVLVCDPRQRPAQPVNFLQENLHLLTTAVSSPVKGSRIVPVRDNVPLCHH